MHTQHHTAHPAPLAPATVAVDFAGLKARQQATWSAGNYSAIGTTLQIVGEELCETLDISAGEKVLDVAAGNGNASLAAARRFAEVTSTDYVPALLDRARDRAMADGLTLRFHEADAEALPFADHSFDVVMSTFGVMFTADHRQAANEMVRVVRRGGRIAMANWTPGGFIGQLFKTIGTYLPPAAGVRSPALWGTREYLADLFGPQASSIDTKTRRFVFRYRSAEHWLEYFRDNYGPMLKTFAALDKAGQASLAESLIALANRFNAAADGTLAVPSEYLEIVIRRD
jgi:ubiquinone/menaquinone biosynthesis C-methylase UbiE